MQLEDIEWAFCVAELALRGKQILEGQIALQGQKEEKQSRPVAGLSRNSNNKPGQIHSKEQQRRKLCNKARRGR